MNRRPTPSGWDGASLRSDPLARVPTRSGQHRTPATPDGPHTAALRQGRVTNQPDTPGGTL